MKKRIAILSGIIAAILAAILIYFRKNLGDTSTVKTFAQIILPTILAGIFAFVPGTVQQKFSRLGLMLGSFFIILSALSPFAFQYWVTQTTPAGYPYTQYGLDALYPFLGIFIVLIAFIIGLVVVLIQDVIRRVVKVPLQGQKKS